MHFRFCKCMEANLEASHLWGHLQPVLFLLSRQVKPPLLQALTASLLTVSRAAEQPAPAGKTKPRIKQARRLCSDALFAVAKGDCPLPGSGNRKAKTS